MPVDPEREERKTITGREMSLQDLRQRLLMGIIIPYVNFVKHFCGTCQEPLHCQAKSFGICPTKQEDQEAGTWHLKNHRRNVSTANNLQEGEVTGCVGEHGGFGPHIVEIPNAMAMHGRRIPCNVAVGITVWPLLVCALASIGSIPYSGAGSGPPGTSRR